MKTLIYPLSIITLCLFSFCGERDKGTTVDNSFQEPLFLNFTSNINLDKYQELAKANSDLTVSKEATADYYYPFYIKSSKINTKIHPWFNTKTGGLEAIFVSGQTKKRDELIELKKMFIDKYKTAEITIEETNIRTLVKASCLNWKKNNRQIKLCIDSFIDSSAEFINSRFKEKVIEERKSYFYCFEIKYSDGKIESANQTKKTKDAI